MTGSGRRRGGLNKDFEAFRQGFFHTTEQSVMREKKALVIFCTLQRELVRDSGIIRSFYCVPVLGMWHHSCLWFRHT